jgi:hypothetical protein
LHCTGFAENRLSCHCEIWLKQNYDYILAALEFCPVWRDVPVKVINPKANRYIIDSRMTEHFSKLLSTFNRLRVYSHAD